jgi:predicted DNA-binding transcriptional regulator YafY
LGRLEELKGLLKGGDYWTASALADELGTSVRTLFRDLELLRSLGTPIEAERGRGGGVRLHHGFGTGRLNIDPLEAIDLLLGISIAEKIGSPLLLKRLPAVRRKIAAVLADGQANRVRTLRKRILVGAPASEAVLRSYAAPKPAGLAPLSQGFFEQREIALTYVDVKGVEQCGTWNRVPLSTSVWYLLGWDSLRTMLGHFVSTGSE